MENTLKEIEELVEVYLDSQVAKPPRKLYRLQIAGDRVYYYFDEEGNPVFKDSVTSVVGKNTPTSPHLIDWIAGMGKEAAEAYRDERAAFGTFMHIIIERLLINGEINLDDIDEMIEIYADQEKLGPRFGSKHSREAKKSVLCFAQFCHDHDVIPIAVEISLASDELSVAGMLDLVCKFKIEESGYWGEVYKSGDRKGEKKLTKKRIEIRAIIDFKSGKNFYPEHALQLEIYRRLWNENYPDYQIDRIFNWAPNDFRGNTPTYKFTEQTESSSLKKIDLILEAARIDHADRKNSATIMSGVVSLKKDLTDNVQVIEYADLAKAKNQKKDALKERD